MFQTTGNCDVSVFFSFLSRNGNFSNLLENSLQMQKKRKSKPVRRKKQKTMMLVQPKQRKVEAAPSMSSLVKKQCTQQPARQKAVNPLVRKLRHHQWQSYRQSLHRPIFCLDHDKCLNLRYLIKTRMPLRETCDEQKKCFFHKGKGLNFNLINL